MLTHRLQKYLSTFKKGFLDDTSYLQSNCSVFSSKIHVHDPITEILIDWQHTTSLRRPKKTLSRYCYTHILFPFFNPPSQKWLRLSCSLQRKYNVLDEFTTPNSNCLWKKYFFNFAKMSAAQNLLYFSPCPERFLNFSQLRLFLFLCPASLYGHWPLTMTTCSVNYKNSLKKSTTVRRNTSENEEVLQLLSAEYGSLVLFFSKFCIIHRLTTVSATWNN